MPELPESMVYIFSFLFGLFAWTFAQAVRKTYVRILWNYKSNEDKKLKPLDLEHRAFMTMIKPDVPYNRRKTDKKEDVA